MEISEIVDNTDGMSTLYAFNPTGSVTQTASEYAAGNATGARISDVVDNTDGSSLVYAYNPTGTATLTAQRWSATNASNGAPAGNEDSDVVDNTDGTSLLYSYNPTGTVTQTASEYSATNTANGAPDGNEISDVVDNTDGTSVLYAYNPTSTVSLTATYYNATVAGNGAPAGSPTNETFDYTNGESAIATYMNGVGTMVDYSGPNGTGSVVSSISGGVLAFSAGTATLVSSRATAAGSATTGIAIAGSGQLIDPGMGGQTIQFAGGATDDTLMLHSGGTDRIAGFDPVAGDMLDLSALLGEAGVTFGSEISQLANYVSVTNSNGAAAIVFDPTGQGGGSQVALLVGDGGMVAQLQTMKDFAL